MTTTKRAEASLDPPAPPAPPSRKPATKKPKKKTTRSKAKAKTKTAELVAGEVVEIPEEESAQETT